MNKEILKKVILFVSIFTVLIIALFMVNKYVMETPEFEDVEEIKGEGMYSSVCVNAFKGNYDSCFDMKFEGYFEGRRDQYSDPNFMLEMAKVDCIWKSMLLNSLVKNDPNACDQVNLNLINLSIPKDRSEKLFSDMCRAVHANDISYCDMFEDIEDLNRSFEDAKSNCVRMVQDTKKLFDEMDPLFCDKFNESDYFDAFKPRCLIILNRDSRGCY